jgi:hydroxymethylglutaryl-CoA synthase
MSGIVSYGVYLPYWRLQRSAITAALGSGGGRGTRSVASYDEDTTSMGAEAARRALAAAPVGTAPHNVWFTTTLPAYADKTNATVVHAALALPEETGAYDLVGSVRSVVGAISAASSGGSQLAVVSDIRTGLPGGADEANGGDAAVALCFGEGDVIAEIIGGASATAEFVDRWRTPGELHSRQWEERFGEYAYLPLVQHAVERALKGAGLEVTDLDHVVISGLHQRAGKAVPRTIGVSPDLVVDDLSSVIGIPGAAQPFVTLASCLDRTAPGKTIAIVLLADGCDVLLLRTTEALVAYRQRAATSVADQIAATRDDLSYANFLTWRGQIHREPPRRPEPDRPAAPPSLRSSAWKYGLFGSRDEAGFVHLPPARVSMESGAIDRMELVRMADVRATIATFSVDRLAYSLSPPVVAAVIDFDGGGRFQCELTDTDPDTVRIGDRVEMTFRRLYTQDGIHNYFWKARPVQGS